MNWKKIFYYQISIYYIIIIFASTNLNVEANSIKESSDESIEEIVEMVSSADEISDIFMGTDSLLPDSQANLSSGFATRRIILMGHLLEKYQGAEKIVIYPAYKETILSFPSVRDTEEAYKETGYIGAQPVSEDTFVTEAAEQAEEQKEEELIEKAVNSGIETAVE